MLALSHPHRQAPPTAHEADMARLCGRRLSGYLKPDLPLSLRVIEGNEEQTLDLPAGAATLLMDILEAMAAGRGVAVIPEDAEVTTVQAAGILGVSRPFLIGLLTAGALPYRKVGRHRRIRMEDVMAFRERTERAREAVPDQLAAEAQENGMGYPAR
jgi:excisionase family DNA binding protein